MAYNLPPPWDPGFALPANVRDEGLERHAYVTKQMPRGTYDMPNVGTGGYAVPDYVMQEGYGQGTYTTKWEPRGQYDGGKIPHWLNNRPRVAVDRRGPRGEVVATVTSPMMAQPYNQGSAVAMAGADEVIASVARAPSHQRLALLKRRIGAKWPRVEAAARAYAANGYSPGNALRAALAQVIGQPTPGALRGRGRARAGALGELPPATMLYQPAFEAAIMQQGSAVPQEGDCSADQQYIFLGGTWQRKVSSRIGGPASVCKRVTSFMPQASGPAGGVTVTDDKGNVQTTVRGQTVPIVTLPPELKYIQVGPFIFPENGGTVRVHNDLPAEWVKWFAEQVTQNYNAAWYAFWKPMSLKRDGTFVGKPGEMVGFIQDQVTGAVPIATVKHPVTGEDWGIYIWNVDRYKTGEFDVSFQKVVDLPLLKKVFTWIVTLPSKLWDKVCNRAYSEGEDQRAAAAGPYAQAGHMVTKMLCGPPESPTPPPDPPPPPSSSSNLLPLAILGGGALAALLLLKKKKKKTP